MPRVKLTQEEVDRRLNERGYELLEPYKKRSEKHNMRHIECGRVWSVRPSSLFQGQGCPKCAIEKQKHSHEQVNERLLKLGYELLEPYRGMLKKHNMRHVECSYVWGVRPTGLFHGQGCPKCGIERRTEKRRHSHEQVNRRLLKLGYQLLEPYKNAMEKRNIRHIECGYVWGVRPNSLVQGQGCPKCAKSGFNPEKPAIVYYLRVSRDGEPPLYKIGITNRTVRQRYYYETRGITVLRTWEYLLGSLALDHEHRVLKAHKKHRYKGRRVFNHIGNTELFTKDVLGLDDDYD